VDEATVRHWREKLEAGAEIPQVTQRTGADGKTYATAGIGAQQQARAATFGEYLQAVRDAVAVAIGQAATTEQRLRWLTVTTIEALMATAPGADRNSVERARRMVLADWVAAVKAEQAAQRVQPETLDQCIAAVWAYVKEEGKTPAERLAALRTALMPHLRRGIHFADSALTVQAKATVVAELERQIEHERQKEARRAAQGGGSASARASGATSAAQSGPARQIEPAEPTTGEDRTSKLHRLKLLFMQCTDALTLWSQMTGREVITLEARRGLRAVIDATSALSDGQAGMDGEGEEVAA
jgi:hypothetical protein